MKLALTHTGRCLLALYFLLPGVMKFVQWDMHVALMETHGMIMVPVLLTIAGVTHVAASICLFMNKPVVVCVLGLASMTLLLTLIL